MTTLSRFTPGLYSAERQAGRLEDLRKSLDTLSRQLSTGRRAETLGEVGAARSTLIDMRAQLSRTTAYQSVNERGALRLSLMSGALDNLAKLGAAARRDALTATGPETIETVGVRTTGARANLAAALDQLNTDLDGQYLFAGRANDQVPVPDAGALLDGDGAAAGLRTLIAERRAADKGDGLGRLTLDQTGATVSLTEENPPTFGFKLKSMVSSLSGGTVTGPDGVPRAVSLSLSSTLAVGQTITLSLSLPDGSSESITLVAREVGQPGDAASGFTIAGNLNDTAANLRASLAAALAAKADTALAAASSMVAAQDFFAATADTPARRIDGPPYDTATGFAASGSRPTMLWYQGDADPALTARDSQRTTIDRGLTLGVGARANEAPLQAMLAGFAVLGAEQPTTGDSHAVERFRALSDRAASQWGPTALSGIVGDLSAASAAMASANERHQQRANLFETAIAGIEQPSLEELSASILSIQTRLEASYQVTASIGRLSLASYLG